jgi:hypothetical protein
MENDNCERACYGSEEIRIIDLYPISPVTSPEILSQVLPLVALKIRNIGIGGKGKG